MQAVYQRGCTTLRYPLLTAPHPGEGLSSGGSAGRAGTGMYLAVFSRFLVVYHKGANFVKR